jgi:hypothetical protein
MNGAEREVLLNEVREQNSRLQQLIDKIAQLVARSREVLRRQRPEVSAPVDDKRSSGT